MNPQRLMMISGGLVILVIAAFAIIPRLTASSPTVDIDYSGNPHVGDPAAPAKVAIFFDFLCPHCATFSESVTPVLKSEFVDSGEAALYFLNFPVVDPRVSREIAVVGECVYEQGNELFTALEPILMRGQRDLRSQADAIDMALAYSPDLDGGALRDCVAEGEAAKRVDADMDAVKALGLTGTPSVAVNGKVVANPSLANIRQAIRSAAN